MTSVYQAVDTTDGRSVALRVSNAALLADPDRLRGLLESSNQIASVQHENILRVFDIGSEGGRFYVATELLPQSLDINLEFRGQMSFAQASRIASGIASGARKRDPAFRYIAAQRPGRNRWHGKGVRFRRSRYFAACRSSPLFLARTGHRKSGDAVKRCLFTWRAPLSHARRSSSVPNVRPQGAAGCPRRYRT